MMDGTAVASPVLKDARVVYTPDISESATIVRIAHEPGTQRTGEEKFNAQQPENNRLATSLSNRIYPGSGHRLLLLYLRSPKFN